MIPDQKNIDFIIFCVKIGLLLETNERVSFFLLARLINQSYYCFMNKLD